MDCPAPSPTLPCEVTLLSVTPAAPRETAPAPPPPTTAGAATREVPGSPREPQREPPPPPPRRPGERFTLLARLGAGGMGVVYRAFDHRLQRPVALKLMRMDGPQRPRRFVREARLQARVQHPNVCRLYEVGRYAGRPFIAMELIDGPTLGEQRWRLSLREKIEVVLGVVEGLEAAHARGLVHRDVKPSNVLLEERPGGGWRPRLVDFGIARELAGPGITATGLLLGTPAYLAPEQARSRARVDHRADLYSAGALLYDLATGRPPFGDGAHDSVLRRLLSQEAVPPRRLVPGLDPDLEAILMRCLEKEPSRRYATARELADDLRRLLAGEPVRARRLTLPRRLARATRRHPRAASWATGVTLALVCLASLWLGARAEAREQSRQSRRLEARVERLCRLWERSPGEVPMPAAAAAACAGGLVADPPTTQGDEP